MQIKMKNREKTHNCYTLRGQFSVLSSGDGRKRSQYTKLVLGSGRMFRWKYESNYNYVDKALFA